MVFEKNEGHAAQSCGECIVKKIKAGDRGSAFNRGERIDKGQSIL
jgi:hypothetical protein